MPFAAINPDRERFHFHATAVQYYLAGRWAWLNQISPVAANLMHHAVEMALKAALARQRTLKQLRNFRHGLVRLWAEFKVTFPEVRVDRLDEVIRDLHAFEALRYPDSVVMHGALIQLVLLREHQERAGPGPHGEPSYVIVLEAVDDLFQQIALAGGLSLSIQRELMTDAAKAVLADDNRYERSWQ